MKNIVICSDGTGNEYGTNNTNVVEAYASMVKDERQDAGGCPGPESVRARMPRPFNRYNPKNLSRRYRIVG
jgi:hypothetical protein